MKKVISLACVILMLSMLAVPAFAVTKDDIIDEIKAGVNVNGTVKYIPDQYINAVENFFAANDFSESELAGALQDLKNAKKIWADSGITEFKNLPRATQDKLISAATSAALKLGAKLTFDGKVIEVVDKNGKSYSVVVGNPIQHYSGSEMNIIILMSVTVLTTLAALAFVSYKLRLNKNYK